MRELAMILRHNRMKKGSLDFDMPEACVKLDENSKPVCIIKLKRMISHQIVEEFMICANEVDAKHLCRDAILYRVHGKPE